MLIIMLKPSTMKNRRENDELIERYCLGLLTPEEYRIFEQWLENDSEMAAAVAEHTTLMDAFSNYKNHELLKSNLQAIHDEIETEQFNFKTPLKVVESTESNIITLIKKYKTIAVAAAVAVFTVSASILFFNLSGADGGKQQTAFQELRREVESIKRKQKAIIQDINDETKSAEVLPDRSFTGTGFALTTDGYILTSYHVVADAKKVYVTNNKFEQLQVETVYTNQALDLALLKVDDPSFKKFADIPYSFKKSIADPGERVFTLGYPREDLIFGEGSISSYTGFDGDTTSYQISIPVNPGNSGGPLFDNQANLLGIITGRNSSAEGASFAVKSKWISDQIKEQMYDSKSNLASGKSLKNVDRATQIKKIKDFVFMVKVYN